MGKWIRIAVMAVCLLCLAGCGQQGAAAVIGTETAQIRSGLVRNGNMGISARGADLGMESVNTLPACGALRVDGTRLVDGSGSPVQLKGVSTHGLSWYPEYVNKECFRQLAGEWGMNVVRLAMYTAESGGYCTDGSRSDLKALVKSGVEYATELGMYVIIDWHILSDGNPNTYIEEAKEFFGEMSEEYADHTNVIYEICNEPNGGTTWSDIKKYAEQVIAVIRSNDEDGVILVGTPNWSQYVDQAAEDPIEGYENIMYTLHFYAGTHKDSLRGVMVSAIEKGLPVFVSEYGICDASGNGAIDEYQADQWVEVLDEYQVSYVAWNLSNKSETSAVIQGGCNKVSGFVWEDLSDSGKWLYGMLQAAEDAEDGGKPDEGVGPGAASVGTTDEGVGPGAASVGDSGEGAGSEDDKTGDSQEEGLTVTADLVNSWCQGEDSYYQYSVTIRNHTGAEQRGWTIRLVFNGDITLDDSWNGNYQVEGDTLTISSMDYNGDISRDGSVGNIGFILHGPDTPAVSGTAE